VIESLIRRILSRIPLSPYRSARSRWQDPKELLAEWDERTRLIAELVPPDCRLIEFGAGRRQPPRFLPPGCRYTPSDFIDRGPGTLVVDLNQRPLPDLRHVGADTAVFGGVFEYVDDLESLITWLGGQFSRCIASYECSGTRRLEPRRDAESRQRMSIGWVNTFHEEELIELFARAGLNVVHTRVWHTREGDEPIFVFEHS
jgi:hypothetical protein